MPIEIQCSSCSKVLRVKDEHAGKSARCPACETVIKIPANPPPQQSEPAANPFGSDSGFGDESTFGEADPFAADAPSAPANPYSNPYATPKTSNLGEKPMSTGSFSPRAVAVDEVFGPAWEMFKANIGTLVACGAIAILAPQTINFGSMFLQIGLTEARVDEVVVVIISLVASILMQLINLFLLIGLVKVCLKIGRGQNVQIGEMFSGGGRYLPTLLGMILYSLITTIGFLFIIVPGIIAAIVLWPTFYLLVDGKTTVGNCISLAYSIGKENALTIFVIGLASVGITMAGMMAFCVGFFFAYPFTYLLSTVAYLKMTNQIR